MKLSSLFSISVMFAMTACGSSQTSSLKQVPVKSGKICDSEFDVPGDPHARVHATRIVFTADLKNADVIEYLTRAFNIGTGQEIFDDLYQESKKTFDVKLSPNQILELVALDTQKVVASIVPVVGNTEKITLKRDDYSKTLSCRFEPK